MKSLTAIAALAAAAPAVSAIKWSVSSPSCDGSSFSNLKVDVTCNGGSSCALGDTATIEGNMYATKSFDDGSVTLQACVVGYCPEMASKDAGSVCDDWLAPVGGQDCGEPGSYAVYHTEDIPTYDGEEELPTAFSWFILSSVTVNVKVGDDEECGGRADNAYSMSYSMAGFVSLAMVGAAAYSSRKRRRNRDVEIEDEKMSRFVEMGNIEVV